MANLSALLDKEASTEIEAILSEARARASEIIAKAEEDAKAITAQRERQSQSQSDAARIRAESSAQLESSSLRLRSQHAAVEKIFEAVEGELQVLTKDYSRFAPMMATLLGEAVEAIGGNDRVGKVIVNPEDVRVVNDAVLRVGLDPKLVETSGSVRGGVKLKAKNNITVENSLYQRLNVAREELASEVSKMLEAPAEG